MATALQDIWQHLQWQLFPLLIDELGELGQKDHEFVEVVSLLDLGPLLQPYRWKGIGCPPYERVWIVLHCQGGLSVCDPGSPDRGAQGPAYIAPTLRLGGCR